MMLNVSLPYNLEILSLDIYLREIKPYIYIKTCI